MQHDETTTHARGPIRVGLCITELDVGGAERCLVDIATRLDRERFEPIVYCLGPRPSDAAASCVVPLEAAGVTVHCLGARSVWRFPFVLQRLRKRFLVDRLDVVQTFLFHANVVGRLAARLAGVRNVVSGIRVAERQARWHLRLERWTAPLAARHVCVSESVAAFTAEHVGVPEEKLVVVPNGVDPALYPASRPVERSSLGLPSERRLMTFIGRLNVQKGVDWLLDTMVDLKQRLPSWDLLIVGDGPERAALERRSREHGLTDRVVFAGWRPDPAEILAASDFFVLPSRWEGMPNVVLQAMASGLPVLSTNVEGVAELLGPLAEEQACAFGDSRAWIEQLAKLGGDAELRAELGRANRERVLEHFTLDLAVERYQELWTALVARD